MRSKIRRAATSVPSCDAQPTRRRSKDRARHLHSTRLARFHTERDDGAAIQRIEGRRDDHGRDNPITTAARADVGRRVAWPRVLYESRRDAETKRDVLVLLAGGNLRVVGAQHHVADATVLCGP